PPAPLPSGERGDGSPAPAEEERAPYVPVLATPTAELDKLLIFRSIHPLYGAFLLDHLGIANREERIQALESTLEMPRPLLRYVRVPWPDQMPPGPLATTRLDPDLIQRGLITAKPEREPGAEEEEDPFEEEKEFPPSLA